MKIVLLLSTLVLTVKSVPISLRSSSPDLSDPKISLVTQASCDKMHLVRGLLERWTYENDGARASIALFAQDDEQKEMIMEEVDYLTEMYGEYRVRFQIHEAVKDEVLAQYPINEMRNLAVQNVDEDSEFAFIVDVDMWPSYETYHILVTSLRSIMGKTKAALVVPPFSFAGRFDEHGSRFRVTAKDLDEARRYDFLIPRTHEELQNCFVFDTKQFPIYKNWHNPKMWIVPHPDESTGLYHKHCYIFDRGNLGGHSSTNISQWWSQEPGSVRRIPCIDSLKYEPYVVLRTKELKSMPFSESLKGYGKNKVDFMRELWVGGYVYYAAGGAFVFHHPHIESPSKQLWRDGTKLDDLQGEDMRSRNDEIYNEMLQKTISKFTSNMNDFGGGDSDDEEEGGDHRIRTPCCETMIGSHPPSGEVRVETLRPPWCSFSS